MGLKLAWLLAAAVYPAQGFLGFVISIVPYPGRKTPRVFTCLRGQIPLRMEEGHITTSGCKRRVRLLLPLVCWFAEPCERDR